MPGWRSPSARVRRRGDRSARLRILVVSHAADLTGAPRVALEIVESLDAWEVVVVLRRRGAREPGFRQAADRVAVEPLHRLCRFLRHFDRTRRLEALLARLIAEFELRRFRPDVVYLNTSESGGYVHPAVHQRLPVVLHLHEPKEAINRILGPHRVDDVLPSVTLVVPSDQARDELSALTGIPGTDIRLVPTTIDAKSIAARAPSSLPPTLTIGTVGSPTIPKGVDLWIDIAKGVIERLPNARIIWVGGSPPAKVKARLHTMGLETRVEFLPPTTDPIAAMREFTILALPSRAETAGMVVQEGMALGLPIVSFRLPAVADHLGDAGCLVPREDVAAMADALVELGRDDAQRQRLGERARKRALERFSMDSFREGVRELVAQVHHAGTS